jgi:uncharacterized membrane protein
MINRLDLKTSAKQMLKDNYWKAFLVSLITVIVNGGGAGGGGGSNVNVNMDAQSMDFNIFSELGEASDELFLVGMIIAVIIAVLVVAVIVCIQVFLCNPVMVSSSKYFVQASEGDADLNNLAFCFNKNHYMNLVKGIFMTNLFITLWGLLLIVPGIIKHYAYRMVPYILADQPNMHYKEAIEKSNAMTYGKKWDIFVLDLSFIGWFLLGVIGCGIGTLFVYPYYYSTIAQLYNSISGKASMSKPIMQAPKQDYIQDY